MFPYWEMSAGGLEKYDNYHYAHRLHFLSRAWPGRVDGVLQPSFGTLAEEREARRGHARLGGERQGNGPDRSGPFFHKRTFQTLPDRTSSQNRQRATRPELYGCMACAPVTSLKNIANGFHIYKF